MTLFDLALRNLSGSAFRSWVVGLCAVFLTSFSLAILLVMGGAQKSLELARLALPRRTYTLSHIEYAVDRLKWLYAHRDLVGGLAFVEEPPVLRFFFGRMAPAGNWGAELARAFTADFGENC